MKRFKLTFVALALLCSIIDNASAMKLMAKRSDNVLDLTAEQIVKLPGLVDDNDPGVEIDMLIGDADGEANGEDEVKAMEDEEVRELEDEVLRALEDEDEEMEDEED